MRRNALESIIRIVAKPVHFIHRVFRPQLDRWRLLFRRSGLKKSGVTKMPSKHIYSSSCLHVIKITPGQEDDAWDEIGKLTENRLTKWGKTLLTSGLGPHVKAILIEPVYVCKDYRNLYSNFYSKKFVSRSSYCSRLHFFSSEDIEAESAVFESEGFQESYIGYSVIEPVDRRCVGRTFIDPYKVGLSQKDHFCLRTQTKVRIHGAEYSVAGFPYRSQSAEATVCAHSALWCACRYLSERYKEYRELYPYDFIELTAETNGRRVPYRGMTYSDYSKILSDFGCHPSIIRPKDTEVTAGAKRNDWSKDRDAFFDLYSHVESGFPVLTSFGGHVVNVIGHTISNVLPADAVPADGFYNSTFLVNKYIVVDDNFFPYRLLGYDGELQYYPAGSYGGRPPTIDGIRGAVVPLPEKAYLPPREARDFICKRLLHTQTSETKINEAIAALNLPDGEKKIVRLFLTSGRAFQTRKRDYYRQNNADMLLKAPIDLNLPHFIWVLEVSTLQTHNERKCFAEIVLDATVNKHEARPIYMRIGDWLLIGDKEASVAGCPSSFSQFTHNLGRL